ncbi:MAG TPA: cytochrome P450 [Jatrophihabitans sp.]|nr:cytochrome P450 [Jatrophihabitans sp.]
MTGTLPETRNRAGALSYPPGPKLPVIAQSLLFGRYRHRWLPLLQRRYGDTFALRIAPHRRRLVLVSRPEDIRAVFSGSTEVFHAGEGNGILAPVMGPHSVLLLDEAEHLRIRRLLLPAFHGPSVRGYRDLMARISSEQVHDWPRDVAFRSHERTSALTLEIIMRVVFGVTDDARLAELRPIVRHIVHITPLIMIGWFYPRLRRYGPWRRFADQCRQLDRLLYAEIDRRRHAADVATRTDVLSRLLRAGDGGLTDAELRDNLITLLLAGHETTATALAWSLHELARNPDVQRRAQRAADTGDEDYLQAVAKETLRLHPIIFEVARQLTEPVELGGYLLPAGAVAMPAVGLVQLDPRHHDTPARFDPERFLDRQPAASTWIPFGGGTRRCLGAGFSLLESTVVLSEVLRRFDIEAVHRRPEPPKPRNVTLYPGRGGTVRLRPRAG